MKKNHILDFDLEQWQKQVLDWGHKSFRARQIFEWLHKHLVFDVQQMKNIPADIKQKLQENFVWHSIRPAESFASRLDDTARYVIQTNQEKQNRKIESVWLPYHNRTSACVSTQQGCSFACSFCATGKMKFGGNLSNGEILSQVYLLSRWQKKRITNIVFMGMGEPLINYQNSLKAAYMLNHPHGLEIGSRKITLSTAGYFPGIQKFIEQQVPFNLAVSVHSFDKHKRKKIMDIEEQYPLHIVLDYLFEHRKILRKNQLTFEYILIQDFNMGQQDIEQLIFYSKKLNAKVNLIPLNTAYEDFISPTEKDIDAFWKKLNQQDVVAINRRSPGRDIAAACGMLSDTK